jgi:two-component system cell cycle response regulator DivK
VLQSEGFQVIEAENAARAMQVLEEHHPDLILMDINLPEVDGYSLTTHLKLRPELKAVPIIALTANVMRGDRERSLEAGCDGYIQKPIDVDTLAGQVDQYIIRSR